MLTGALCPETDGVDDKEATEISWNKDDCDDGDSDDDDDNDGKISQEIKRGKKKIERSPGIKVSSISKKRYRKPTLILKMYLEMPK